jgi:CDP-diacylglycerol pyrophosphatase
MGKGGLLVRALFVWIVTAFASTSLAAARDREALWRVVQTCLADFKLIGAAFPCLEVSVAQGDATGYVVLRSPFGPRQLILSPTRRVVGVEAPWLQSPEAPNYFEAALRARSFLRDHNGKQPSVSEVALAVNPAAVRSQDQLHIHIGCLSPAGRRATATFGSELEVGKWTRLEGVFSGPLWGFRVGRSDLEGIDPIHLALEGPANKVGNRAWPMIAVAVLQVSNRDELLIVASLGGLSAEQVVDPKCSGQSMP